MATELDLVINRTLEMLVQPGAPLELGHVERFGVQLPYLKAAPPSLAHYFAATCAQHGDEVFLVDGDIRLSFAQTHEAATALARALLAEGVQKGDRVGIAARNSANWIIAYMAILMAGGVASLLNGWWAGEELAAGIDDVGCKLVLADEGRARRLEGHAHGARLLMFRHDVPPAEGFAGIGTDAAPDAMLPDLGPDDLATILFTSGSTGKSKGAYSDHRGVLQGTYSYVGQSVLMLTILAGRGEAPANRPATLLNVPLFHVTAMVPVLLQSFAIGRKLVLMPRWDAEEAMRLIEREKVTYFVGVPLMSYDIATHPKRRDYDLSTCVSFAAGGAPRPVEHVKRIKEEMDWAFPLLGYGLTETNGVGCGNFNENYMAKPDSTGTPSRPLCDLAILDDAGRPLPTGEVGEVAIRSIANFLGYWENEEATRAAIMPDGYFRTGDLGYLDEDNYLFIVDRKKDIVIRGGENISCIEVEAAIYAHPQIAEVSVFGLPDARYGEVPGAVYFTRDGADISPEQLTEFLGEHLAQFKIPARFWRSDEPLPRLGTEKIDKNTLRNRYRPMA